MSGLLTITVQEQRGFVAIPAELDRLAVVIGCSSAGSGMSSFFVSGSSAVADRGYGDAVDTLTQIIEQRLPNGNGIKSPAAMYTGPAGTVGAYGAIDVSDVTGTALVVNDTTLVPFGTYEARVKAYMADMNAKGRRR